MPTAEILGRGERTDRAARLPPPARSELSGICSRRRRPGLSMHAPDLARAPRAAGSGGRRCRPPRSSGCPPRFRDRDLRFLELGLGEGGRRLIPTGMGRGDLACRFASPPRPGRGCGRIFIGRCRGASAPAIAGIPHCPRQTNVTFRKQNS